MVRRLAVCLIVMLLVPSALTARVGAIPNVDPAAPDSRLVLADDAWPVTDQLGGETSHAFVDGETIYYDVGPRIVALDASNAGRPTVLWRGEPVLSASLLHITDSVAYFARGSTLVLAAVSPSHPVLAEITLPGRADEVALGDGGVLAIVGVSQRRTNLWLSLFDVSDPREPVALARLDWERPWFWIPHVSCDGARVAVAYSVDAVEDVAEVLIVDSSVPTEAHEVARTALPSPFALKVLLDGDQLYVLADDSGGRLLVMDVSDPATIGLLASKALPRNPTDLVRSEYWLALSMGSMDGDAATDAFGGRVGIWDVSSPAEPESIGLLIVPDDAADLDVAHGQLCVAARSAGLLCFDASDPAEMTQTSAWPSWPAYAGQVAAITDAVVVYDSTYVGTEPEVAVIDTSRSGGLLQRGVVTAPLAYMDPMAAAADFAFFGHDATPDDQLDYASRLSAMDLTDRDQPKVLESELVFDDSLLGIALVDHYAFMANRFQVQVVDVADPTAPTVVGSHSDALVASDVAADGDQVYVYRCCGTDDSESWQYFVDTISASDPTRPTVTHRFPLPYPAEASSQKLVADDDIVVVYGRYIVSYVDPTHPVVLARADRRNGRAFTVGAAAMRGGRLLLGTYDCLRAIDVADPRHPHQIGAWPIGAQDISMTADRAYVAAYELGLFELSLSHAPMSEYAYGCEPFVWREPSERPNGSWQVFLPRLMWQ